MEQVKYYLTTPEKHLKAEDVLVKLQEIKRINRKKVIFGRWDNTNYKRIYVDISSKYNEIGYIDLIRVKFVVTVKAELDFFTPELIDAVSYKINMVLDNFRTKKYELTWDMIRKK